MDWLISIFGLAVLGLMTAYIIWVCWKVLPDFIASFDDIKRERRKERGYCAECGYDLRAGHYHCPECGCSTAEKAREEGHPKALNIKALTEIWREVPLDPCHPDEEIPVAVYQTENAFEAQVLAKQMNTRGVWSKVEYRDSSGRIRDNVVDRNTCFVVVLPDDQFDARRIMDRFRNDAMPYASRLRSH